MNKAEPLLQIPEMCTATSVVSNTDLRSCAVWQWYRRLCSEQVGFPLVQEAWHQPHCELAQVPMGAVKAGLCAGLGVSAPAFLLSTGVWPQAALVCTASSPGDTSASWVSQNTQCSSQSQLLPARATAARKGPDAGCASSQTTAHPSQQGFPQQISGSNLFLVLTSLEERGRGSGQWLEEGSCCTGKSRVLHKRPNSDRDIFLCFFKLCMRRWKKCPLQKASSGISVLEQCPGELVSQGRNGT